MSCAKDISPISQRKYLKQAGAELCQAQGKLRLVVLWHLVKKHQLKLFIFTNLANEFDYGTVIVSLWKVLFCRFGLAGLVC